MNDKTTFRALSFVANSPAGHAKISALQRYLGRDSGKIAGMIDSGLVGAVPVRDGRPGRPRTMICLTAEGWRLYYATLAAEVR